MEIILLFIFSLVIMFVSLAGVVLPFLPGAPLAWFGILIFAVGTRFEKISLVSIIVFLCLTMLTWVLDFIIPLIGAKKYKASRYGILGASLGFLLGTFIFGPMGIIIGPLLGAVAGELLAKRPPGQAAKSAWGTFLGFLASSLIKITLIFIMMGFLIASLF